MHQTVYSPGTIHRREFTEEQLLQEIAYCKARLADIQKAPKDSRHKEGLSRATGHLKECQRLLAKLRNRC